MMTIEEKLKAVKTFIEDETVAAYKLRVNLRMIRRKMTSAKDSEMAQYGQMVDQMVKTLRGSEQYLEFLGEVKAELEAGIDYELKDIPKA